MEGKIKYEFRGKLWKTGSEGSWYFISLPQDISLEIRSHLKWQEEGWGRMKARAEIAKISWNTAIWFDTKMQTYLLSVKATIRAKANLEVNNEYTVRIWI